ncbi:SAM hydrolase/SAM-dependent halogenase family protein [Pseudodesulfovibrio sp.]|uniref:SAM hydrolase/SAM-dependent halogenase family protein n=1 Tax=unclassified Pseudodesulfovibrio TaxID=2661612 RepID=UPI003AFFB667
MFAKREETPPRTIGLLTDFGVTDPYVGQVKAVLARKAPSCQVVDISHRVQPYNVAQAAFFLASSYMHFPKDAIIMAVVDPGVGTSRRIVGVSIGERFMLAPDNGLLALAVHNAWTEEVRAFDLSVAVEARSNIAQTFHGRDVFAPLAAWLALGGEAASLGTEIDPADLVTPCWAGSVIDHCRAQGHVLHVDRFGNCVLNLPIGTLPAAAHFELVSPAHGELAFVTAYADMPDEKPGLLEGSQGFLEIAVNQRSAARQLGLSMGDRVELTWEE